MKDKRVLDNRLIALLLALITTILALFGSASLSALPLIMQIILPILLGVIVYLLMEVALRLNIERGTSIKLNKILAALVIICIGVSTYSVLKSIWINPVNDGYGNRFIFENIATAAGLASIILTFILSTLQSDIYLVSRKQSITMDERQIKDRQQVFESSYKLAAFLVLASAWYFMSTVHNIPAIIDNHHRTIPGHLFWLPFNVALAVFALPLIVAAKNEKQ